MKERIPDTHDMNMEGKERTWRERKERTRERKGKERKYAKTLQSSPKLVYVRYMYVYVYLYFKSRNHDLLKELKELDGIIEQRRRAVSNDLGSKVAS